MGTSSENSSMIPLLPLTVEDPNQTSESHQHTNAINANNGSGSSVQNATANIIKSGIGTGVLFMPYVFSQCGILLSIFLMAFMGTLSFYCWSKLCLVIRVLESKGTSTIPLTLETAAGLILGDRFKRISTSMTLVFIYGTSIGYAIFIINTMQPYFNSPFLTLAIIMVIYMPLSMWRQIEQLGFFSQIGLISLCLSIFTIIMFSSWQIIHPTTTAITSESSSLHWVNLASIPLNFGVFAFAYDINGVVTEVHATMANKHLFDTVLFRFIVFSLCLGCALGIVGYIAFTDNVSPVIFLNFNSHNFLTQAISTLFSFSLIASILLYGFPIVKTADRALLSNNAEQPQIVQMVLIRLAFFLSIAFFAVYVKSVMNVFNLLGSVFSVVLTFIFPIVLLERMKLIENNQAFLCLSAAPEFTPYESTRSSQPSKDSSQLLVSSESQHSHLFSIAILTIGIIGGISGLLSSFYDMMQ